MEAHDRLSVAMGAVRDQLLAVIEQYERDGRNGKLSAYDRLNAVAYLAHCLGVRTNKAALLALRELMRDFRDVGAEG